jgi:hypothetical protein
MNAEHIADQVLPTGAAFAGLLLVFLSNAVSGFEGYETPDQGAVRRRYMRRGWLAFAAFTTAVLSSLLSLLFYWDKTDWTVLASGILLILSLVLGLIAALITSLDIR